MLLHYGEPLTLDITNPSGTMSLQSAVGYSAEDTSKGIWPGAYLTSTGDKDNYKTFYSNAAGGLGGTIFSYNGPLGKFRIDWDPAHGFHCHPPGH